MNELSANTEGLTLRGPLASGSDIDDPPFPFAQPRLPVREPASTSSFIGKCLINIMSYKTYRRHIVLSDIHRYIF